MAEPVSQTTEFEGVPQDVVDAFLQGLDDVKHGRVVSIDETLAEGRRLIEEYRRRRDTGTD